MNLTNKYIAATGVIFLIVFNEFTLVYLDSSPPLSDKALSIIRSFNFIFLVFSFAGKFFLQKFSPFISKISRLFMTFIFPSLLAIILFDIFLKFMGFGYPSHYEQENILRYPSPGDNFSGKPNSADHNKYGFRGTFEQDESSFSIAMFGGSTGYYGNPSIIETVKSRLEDRGLQVNVFNFSSLSSNHTQHLHRLLKYYDKFNLDIVIFYGGGNETVQYASYDPRPGYPYNFFFRNDLSPIRQSLIRYSSILGELDKLTGFISKKKVLDKNIKVQGWEESIIEKYWRDLSTAHVITSSAIKPNICKNSIFISITQPANVSIDEHKKLWDLLKVSMSLKNYDWDHYNFTKYEDVVEFDDAIHLKQTSRNLMGNKISDVVFRLYKQKCF